MYAFINDQPDTNKASQKQSWLHMDLEIVVVFLQMFEKLYRPFLNLSECGALYTLIDTKKSSV